MANIKDLDRDRQMWNYVLDDVNCDGDETSLFECRHNDKHNCHRGRIGDERASVSCIGMYTAQQ